MNRSNWMKNLWLAALLGGWSVCLHAPATATEAGDDDSVLLVQADDAMDDEPADRARNERPGPDRERLEKLRDRRERRAAEDGPSNRPRPVRPPRELSAEQRERALAVLRDVNPRLAEKMEEALKSDKASRAERMLARMSPRLLEMDQIKQRDPEAYELRVADNRAKLDTIRIAGKLRRAKANGETDDAAQYETELRENLDKHFEIRQRLREKELQLLEQRIERMRVELKEHRAKKQQLIEQSLTRIRDGRAEADEDHEPGDRPHDRARRPLERERDDQLNLD